MSDIAGPPAPKEVQPSVRGTDRAAQLAKDPNNANAEARSRDTSQDRSSSDHQDSVRSRDPAVSIAATAAHLSRGQEINETVDRVDAEGRPVVVTDTLTIALKPDAGLKPGDEVQLRVVEADTRITADLVQQNAREIDPPIRLAVTVIEVHQPKPDAPQAAAAKPSLADVPYRPSQTQTVTTTQVSDEVALLVSGKTSNETAPVSATLRPPLTPVPSDTTATLAGAPRTSSADLATLIQQQQTTATVPSVPPAPNAAATQPVQVPFLATSGPGVGPAIAALGLDGTPAIIQLLDPSISKVSPVEIATVTKVQALAASEARTVPVGAAALASIADSAGELARVETSRGTYILPARTAASFTDELIRVVVDNSSPATSNGGAPEQKRVSYVGQFTTGDAASAIRVAASFAAPDAADKNPAATSATPNPANTSAPQQTGFLAQTTITSVETTGAFLSATGPRTDLKITTEAGVLSVTVPSSVRPEIGSQLVLSDPEPVAATHASTQANALTGSIPPVQTADAVTAATTIAAHAPNLLSGWPALEESLAALSGSAQTPGATESLTAKTAQGGGKLTNALLFFLSATGRNNPSGWLGQGTERALAETSPSILKGLQSDLARMASLPAETIGEWRPIIIPFDARPTEVPLIAFLLHARPDIDPDANSGGESAYEREGDDGQRFLLQVQFSVLGDIQLDGRIRKTDFDLTVRSSGGFSSALKQDLETLFYQALAANGFGGGLRFQENTSFDVDAAKLIEDHLLQNPAA